MNWFRNAIMIFIFCVSSQIYCQTRDTLKTVLVETERTTRPSKTHKTYTFSDYQTDEFSLNSLSNLLSKSSSVYIKSYGEGNIATPSIRGTGANHTQLYWNGIQVNSPTLGQSDLSLLPVFFFNSAELHLGSSSIADGSGGIGGAIQLSNKLAYNSKLNLDLHKSFGSFGLSQSSIGFQFGSTRVQSSTKIYSSEAENDFNYRDLSKIDQPLVKQLNNYYKQFGVGQDVSFKLNSKHEIDFKSLFFNSYREIAPILGSSNTGQYQKDNSRKLLVGWHVLRDKSTHYLKIAAIYDGLFYEDTIANIESEVNTESYSVNYNAKLYLSPIKLNYTVTHQVDKAISSGFRTDKVRQRSAVFVQSEKDINDQFLCHLAVRQEFIDDSFAPLSPSLGVKYTISDQTSFSLNGSKTFRAPTLNDLYWSVGGNSDLLPEVGHSSEFNLSKKIKLNNKIIETSITGFYSVVNNWIQWQPTSFGYWAPLNLKKVLNRGVEANLKFKTKLKNSIWKVESNVNYAFTKSSAIQSFIVSDNSIGKQLIYVPQHIINVSTQLSFKNVKVTYFQTLTGRTFIDASNTVYMPYFAPADLAITYVFNTKIPMRFGVKVRNIFNEEYQVVANRPLPMRHFNVFLKLQFKE